MKREPLNFLEVGASYEGDRWLWSAELATLFGQFPASHTINGYTSLGRRFGPLTVYGVLAASRTKGGPAIEPQWGTTLAPLIGPQAAAQAQYLGSTTAMAINTQRQSQRSLSLGVRWDLNSQTAWKLQWDRYFVDEQGSFLYRNAMGKPGRVDVGSIVLDFVF